MSLPKTFLVLPVSVALLAACGDDGSTEPADTVDGSSGTTATTTTTTTAGTSSTSGSTTDTPTTSTTANPTTGDPTTGDPTTGGTTGGDNGLEPDDLPDVAPCPEQALLTDSAMLDTLKTALTDGAITYLDVPFDMNDTDIFLKKCGFNEFWDPADNTDEIAWMMAIDPTVLTVGGNSGICGTSTDPFNDPAFPAAGTYRKEMRVSHMAATYHLRWRVDVSGPAAGMTYSSQSINVAANGLVDSVDYTVAGTASTHDDLFGDIVDALSTTGELPTVTVNVDASGGGALFSADVTVLCAAAE